MIEDSRLGEVLSGVARRLDLIPSYEWADRHGVIESLWISRPDIEQVLQLSWFIRVWERRPSLLDRGNLAEITADSAFGVRSQFGVTELPGEAFDSDRAGPSLIAGTLNAYRRAAFDLAAETRRQFAAGQIAHTTFFQFS